MVSKRYREVGGLLAYVIHRQAFLYLIFITEVQGPGIRKEVLHQDVWRGLLWINAQVVDEQFFIWYYSLFSRPVGIIYIINISVQTHGPETPCHGVRVWLRLSRNWNCSIINTLQWTVRDYLINLSTITLIVKFISVEIVQAEACIVERLGRYLSRTVIELTPRKERFTAHLLPSQLR